MTKLEQELVDRLGGTGYSQEYLLQTCEHFADTYPVTQLHAALLAVLPQRTYMYDAAETLLERVALRVRQANESLLAWYWC